MISALGEVLEEDVLFLPARFVLEVEEERVVRAMGEEMWWRKGGRAGREGEGGFGKVYGCWERGDSGRRRERKRKRRGKGKGKRREEKGRRRALEGEQEKGFRPSGDFRSRPGSFLVDMPGKKSRSSIGFHGYKEVLEHREDHRPPGTAEPEGESF